MRSEKQEGASILSEGYQERRARIQAKLNEMSDLIKMSLTTGLSREELASRFGYHKGTEETMPMHQTCRSLFLTLAAELEELLPNGRAKILAMTELENASMWANKAVAEKAPVVNE